MSQDKPPVDSAGRPRGRQNLLVLTLKPGWSTQFVEPLPSENVGPLVQK